MALANCTVSGNTASSIFQGGGGVRNTFGATATLTGCTLTGNSASYGGGLYNGFSGKATLADCIVSSNSASGGGGGVFDYASATTTLTTCTLNDNVAHGGGSNEILHGGGGVQNCFSSTVTLTNCTLSGNSSTTGGGGVSNRSLGTATLTNCTVSGNSAVLGGGLFNNGATLNVGNTIVAQNTASTAVKDVLGTVTSAGHNLIGVTDGSAGWVASDLTGTFASPLKPLLAPLGNYGEPTQTMPLLPGSPAIDAGHNALIPAGVRTDQRGLPRVVNRAVDIGAFESSGFTIALTSGSGQTTDVFNVFSASLVVTVTAQNPSEPVAGGRVTFSPPSSGASATIIGSPATISATGTASVTATANGHAGTYTVSARARGITTPARLSLSNRPTIRVPAAQTAYQNVDQPISGIRIGDARRATLTVTLTVSHGTLTLATTTGLTSVNGNGTGSVTLIGATTNLNAALATLVYRGIHNYSRGDTLSLTATDSGVSATPASVAITVESLAQEATNLRAMVSALQTAGVLNQEQAHSLIVKLNLNGNNGDIDKVQAFLNEVRADLGTGILTQAQADPLLYWGNILLLGVIRR
jgi:hypothetical protein